MQLYCVSISMHGIYLHESVEDDSFRLCFALDQPQLLPKPDTVFVSLVVRDIAFFFV